MVSKNQNQTKEWNYFIWLFTCHQCSNMYYNPGSSISKTIKLCLLSSLHLLPLCSTDAFPLSRCQWSFPCRFVTSPRGAAALRHPKASPYEKSTDSQPKSSSTILSQSSFTTGMHYSSNFILCDAAAATPLAF